MAIRWCTVGFLNMALPHPPAQSPLYPAAPSWIGSHGGAGCITGHQRTPLRHREGTKSLRLGLDFRGYAATSYGNRPVEGSVVIEAHSAPFSLSRRIFVQVLWSHENVLCSSTRGITTVLHRRSFFGMLVSISQRTRNWELRSSISTNPPAVKKG